MQNLDYTPFDTAGLPLDVEATGGHVDLLSLWPDAARSGPPAVTTGPATRVATATGSGFVYRFTLPDDVLGRFFASVSYVPNTGDDPFTDFLSLPVDLPSDGPGRVSAYAVAIRAGVDTPTPKQLALWHELIEEAYGEVEAFLNKPARPTVITETLEADVTGWHFSHDPVIKVLTVSDQRDDYQYDVTYLAGLTDPIALEAIANYVRYAVLEKARWTPGSGLRPNVTSVSVEGQSMSFGGGPGGTRWHPGAAAGSPPTLRSLSRWKRRGVYSPPIASAYYPSGSSYVGLGPSGGDARYNTEQVGYVGQFL